MLRALVIDPRIKVAVIWAGVTATYKDLLENWHPPAGIGSPPSFNRDWPSGFRRRVWDARSEPTVLGLDLADVVPIGYHRADPDQSRGRRCRDTGAVFADAAADLQAAGKPVQPPPTRATTTISRAFLAGDGPLGCLPRSLLEVMARRGALSSVARDEP